LRLEALLLGSIRKGRDNFKWYGTRDPYSVISDPMTAKKRNEGFE
jgi:hypothetical protein